MGNGQLFLNAKCFNSGVMIARWFSVFCFVPLCLLPCPFFFEYPFLVVLCIRLVFVRPFPAAVPSLLFPRRILDCPLWIVHGADDLELPSL